MAPVPHPPLPNAHTVTYSPVAPNSKDSPHTLTFSSDFGDGDPARWPAQGADMVLLSNENEKQRIWRRTAGEMLAKDLGYWDVQNQFWIVENLPTGYGLFQQTTHPKPDSLAVRESGGTKGKLRYDRFIFGHNSRKIRSAVSLGKHISFLLFGRIGHCNCDGCKVAAPRPSLAATGAETATPMKLGTRKRKRTSEYDAAVALAVGGGGGEDGDDDGDYMDEDEGSPKTARGRKKEASLPPPKKRAPSLLPASRGLSPVEVPHAGANVPLASGPAAALAAIGATSAPPPKKATRARKSRNAWDDDEGEDDGQGGMYADPYTARGDGSGGSDDDWNEYGKVSVGGRTSSGRRSKPSTKALSGSHTHLQDDLAPADDFLSSMSPATASILASSSTVPPEQTQQDLSFPSLLRVGELVWVRVPLGPPPQGSLANAQLSRWPGIVRSRTIVVAAGPTGAVEEQYRVELLGMSAQDTLEGVRGENVTPWVGYIPANVEFLDGKEGWRPGEGEEKAKKRWADIQGEGWEGVAEAFRKAHRIAKAYSAIQIRPVPMLKTGPHLARSTGAVAPPTSFQALVPRPPRSQYLTYSHLIFGPELLHLHDFLRLSPSVDLDPLVARQRMPKTAFPTTLIMRLGSLYRSGAPASSPLIAKGLVFEQVEIPPSAATLKAITQTGDLELLWKPVAADHLSDPSLLELPSSYYQNLPLPLPFHRWRLLAPPRSAAAAASTSSISALETSVLFSPSIAGRFYPLSPSTGTLPVRADPRLVQKVLAEAERGVHWWTHKKGDGARGGKGEEGIRSLGLVMGGLEAGGKGGTVRIEATNGLTGGRVEQLAIAEEQALLRPAARANRSGKA